MQIHYPDRLFNSEEIQNTPDRVARFLDEWAGNNDFKFTTFPNPGYDQLIVLKHIEFSSMCSHHLLPFHGVAHVGYLPANLICGISKLARVVDKFASRPQIQEKMTNEIAEYLRLNLKPDGVMVVVEATHDCMRIRGVKKPSSVMVTSSMMGKFRDNPSLKEEFLKIIST